MEQQKTFKTTHTLSIEDNSIKITVEFKNLTRQQSDYFYSYLESDDGLLDKLMSELMDMEEKNNK